VRKQAIDKVPVKTCRPAEIVNKRNLQAERFDFDRIPVIDIGATLGGDPDALRETAQAIREACINVGFFYVRNHGVPEWMTGAALTRTEQFFALSRNDKLKYDIARLGYHRGYVPFGALSADPDGIDRQEGFEIGLELPRDDPDVRAGRRIYGPNVWPEEIPGFADDLYAYFIQMLSLGRRLFALFAVALDLPAQYFEAYIDKPMAQLRLIHYPPAAAGREAASAIGIGAHTDYECFTILWQSDAGLQVQNRAGLWIGAPPIPGTFVINIGDMLQRWTNDLFVSTPHRVITRPGGARYSLPFFFATGYHAVVTCLDNCCGPDNPPHYPPTKCGYWTETMHTYAYAYRYEDRGRIPNPEGPGEG